MEDVLTQIRQELAQSADAHTRQTGQRYFKEEIKLYGVKTALVSTLSKKYFPIIRERSKAEILRLCEDLWASGFMEESFIACSWAELLHKRYQESDLQVFEHWLEKYVSNWASCDTLCNHTVGTYLEMYPAQVGVLKTWAVQENRWLKRAACVSLIIPARKGMFLEDIFEIACLVLVDRDDLVQKGYGWMLKSASQYHQEAVFQFVLRHKERMPRTALRYAIEKMPVELKKEAMHR
jgi:3-methyladenine DNA glycosylase AlkD